MLSVSLCKRLQADIIIVLVQYIQGELKGYAKKIFTDEVIADEALHRAFMWAIDHWTDSVVTKNGEVRNTIENGQLTLTGKAYMKSLVKTLGVKRDSREVFESSLTTDDTDTHALERLAVVEDTYGSGEDEKACFKAFIELYLRYEEDFMKFALDVLERIAQGSKTKIKANNKDLYQEMTHLFHVYPHCYLEVLRKFISELQVNKQKSKIKADGKIKIAPLQKYDPSSLNNILVYPIHQGRKRYTLNKDELLIPDFQENREFSVEGLCNRDIVKIYIDGYMNTLYTNIMTDVGITTPNILWLCGFYMMTSPSGEKSEFCGNRENFIEFCRRELISNLLNIVGGVVAISQNYVFCVPARKLPYSELVLCDYRGLKHNFKLEQI